MKKGLPVPPDEEDDAALLEVADGPPADERLGDLAHLDRRHQAGRDSALLERVLQGQSVDHGREQAHVVAGHAVDALRRRGHAPDDVAAAEDDRGLDPEGVDLLDLVGETGDHVRRDAEPLVPHQRLPRELQEDASIDGRLGQASQCVAGIL